MDVKRRNYKMARYYITGLSILIFAGLFIVTNGSVCEDNRGSGRFIRGDNSKTINYFLRILRRKKTFDFMGDNKNHEGCRRMIGKYVHRKGFYVNDTTMVILDCWEPTECTLIEERGERRDTLRLVPKSVMNFVFWTRVNTVLLPIDERNTISYTLLPYVSQRSILFVTSLVSGCSVFVATSDNIDCSIIVMHANHFCRNFEDDDDNHEQAMSVIAQVQITNQQCKYRIQRRWASDHKRPNIEKHNYYYSDSIVYYRIMAGINFVYGYILGGHGRKWQFCVKELQDSPRQEICKEIL
ncbi:uncharacterized protein LOC123559158 isoform X2 [Mercenaria mercenaria]|uniref:uncharacterized protein LOC123559158 isoform X2 n=1 Tax=Mercenaria mercenaria TaxID=6596 RepID=UPI00234E4E99|nr:uncharacterized protein LOC123559158 isoform X2 [Mercenaria mercenaria]